MIVMVFLGFYFKKKTTSRTTLLTMNQQPLPAAIIDHVV
jgi:hypothetical protein